MTTQARLNDLAISESGFVFDPYSGGTFTVNKSAMVLLRALREGLDRDGMKSRLRDEFQVADADLDNDVGEFTRLLVQQGLLPPDFALDSTLAGAQP
jgi:hypothetical protein